MMNRKAIAVFLALFMLWVPTGCQLAREDMTQTSGDDRLIGVFVTKDYLDLFDMERYLNDTIHKVSDSGSFTIDGNTNEYQGRLYATLVTRTLTDPETGGTFDTKEFVFEGVEGISYFCATVPATQEEHSFTTTGSDEAISDGHAHLHYGDEEDKISLEGTIYFSSDRTGGMTCHINPVYQSADGKVYATSGSGFMADGGDHGEGSVYSQTMEETTTITENGKSKSAHTSVKISIALMFSPKQIIVLQMDKEGIILTRTEYVPGELPDTLTPERDAAFIIVETHKRDREGNGVVSRSLYDEGTETLETFYSRADGICIKQWTTLNWNKP